MFTILKVWIAGSIIAILLKLGGFIDLEWAWVTSVLWAPALFFEGVIIAWVLSAALYERFVSRRDHLFTNTECQG